MIKIKLYELDKHRNECAFRPYLWAHNVLRDVGIEFTEGDSYDYAWVAQASFLNKKVSLQESVDNGLEFLSKITGDYMLLDGQDSTSLIGAYEVFKESNALFLLKNSLLKDRPKNVKVEVLPASAGNNILNGTSTSSSTTTTGTSYGTIDT